MTAALRALMSGVIDYAGLFPPAKLWLGEAVREYVEIRESAADAWMLGRFVVPASQLSELERWGNILCRGDRHTELAATGRPAADFQTWQQQLQSDVKAIEEFLNRWSDRIEVASLELPLCENIDDEDGPDVSAFISSGVSLLHSGLPIRTLFLEVPAVRGADEVRLSVIRQLGRRVTTTTALGSSTRLTIGFKFRTGGLTANAFPTGEQLANIVSESAAHNCPWKATAGLHHALPREDAEIGATMHGFLNVLFASAFARSQIAAEGEILQIIRNRDPRRFQIDGRGIHWNGRTIPVPALTNARSGGFQSFGSCSFAEPRDDLTKLGLL